jgi:hypothetical protein
MRVHLRRCVLVASLAAAACGGEEGSAEGVEVR